MPKIINMMKKREEEILKIIRYLSEETDGFSEPRMVMIGGYALRAFIKFSRYTRDCDFVLRKRNGWSIDYLKDTLPKDWKIENLEKRDRYGFMRWLKFIAYDKTRIRVSTDFMEGEIRGRKEEEIISIDERMIENSKPVSILIAGERVEIPIPDYLDYFIMKVISCRASDIRDIASLLHEKGVPSGLGKRVREIIPHQDLFSSNIQQRIIPEVRKRTFIDSWRGIMATTEFTEKDKEQVMRRLEELLDK